MGSESTTPTLPKEAHCKENFAPQSQQYRLYRKESDPKGIKIVPQGHQNRLYRRSAHEPKQHLEVNNTDFTYKESSTQQQKQASRSPPTTSQNESTQKGSRMKPEVESSKNEGQKAKPMQIKKKNPQHIAICLGHM